MFALRPQKSAIEKWQTNHWLSLVYPLYFVYSIFTPTWISIVFNCPSSASCCIQCSLVHWLRLCSREIVCTCRTFRTFVRIAVYLNFHCKTNDTADDKQGKKHNQSQKSHCSLATFRKRNSWRKMNPSDTWDTFIIANSSADSSDS